MLFNSLEYLIFLPVVFIIYWLLKNSYKKQNILLLISSYIFYGWWDYRFLSLIIFSSFLDYFVGQKIEDAIGDKNKKHWLLVSLFSNLGLLGVFKYYNFFADSFASTMSNIGWEVNDLTLNIILPVGISFYTFQTLSYSIDIYRNQIKASRDIVGFFTFVSLFPQLVAGPIERASNLIPQIERKRNLNITLIKTGIFQIFIGLFRKVAIADNLGIYVDSVYSNYEIHNSSTLLVATIFYAFQIYFDFSGYSDIAIGSAKLFGFKFNRNFNFPYFSRTLTEFWRRWHMSLSFWLRDYLYISLGGNRKGIIITYRNLLLTMLIGGLWHGSSWNFVIWGGIHGLFLSLEKYTFSALNIKTFNAFGYIYTFVVVLVAWIFFRAPDFHSASTIITEIFSFDYGPLFIGNINAFVNAVLLLLIGFLIDLKIFRSDVSLEEYGTRFSSVKLSIIVSIIILMLCLFYSTAENFIYFQF
ncbi:D-alanyl-lipoteichoic acid acyltransferase DltB (MBOAT superfamily) [Winogradskyella eximia]|uniref:D-alanyl-lipoteichoic acid acyltransferase DltB (MBOAT superfamily) n=1 Tax=Winogradskyella eximia TaxID=262006 RepID=A0A3D9H793_9FLAO|nr:MBOAT family O-acyltransferase [Winogradskyella eximia]RED45363.1 D-alanyl-lipoteichoic acid acyltransferase DltB (MBOAT superfamily) [Winogradskyella eximia]